MTSIGATIPVVWLIFLPEVTGSPTASCDFCLATCGCALLGHVRARLLNSRAMAKGQAVEVLTESASEGHLRGAEASLLWFSPYAKWS